MDLNTVTGFLRPASVADVKHWDDGCAWLGGGTWLFSEPQPQARTLIDLRSMNWNPIDVLPEGLAIAATCSSSELYRFRHPPQWHAGPLLGECCGSLLASH